MKSLETSVVTGMRPGMGRRRPAPSARPRAGGGPRRGFTLAEVLVVVVVLAVMGALVLPHAVGTTDMQVISAARMVTADLEYAQNQAITTQAPVTVTFTPSEERYALSNASGPLIHPMTNEAYETDFTARRGFEELDMVSASFGGAASVTFDELGAPENAGTVRLQAGAHVCDVSVAAATGKVSVTVYEP